MAETYDPALVSVIAASVPLTGLAEGTPLTVARNNDAVTLKKGMHNASGWAENTKTDGTITVVLMGTHPDNDVLSLLEATKKEFPVMIKDNSGRSLHFAESCRIQKPADKVYGDEIQDTTWIILCADLIHFNAGN